LPKHPNLSPSVLGVGSAVFSKLAHKISSLEGEVFPLHVGDTYMEPCIGSRMEDLSVTEHPGMHRYVSPQGIKPLIDCIYDKVESFNGLTVEKGSVLVSAGATGALTAGIGAVTSPGDEVLILAPFWPLIRGIVSTLRATPVEVPFYDRVQSVTDVVDAISDRITSKTVAIYVSTPSNPTGVVLPEQWLQAIAELARERGLWVFSDEVYERYVFEGEPCSIGRFAPERTLTAFSFSKTYGMAGNRCGYLVGPPDIITQCRKVSTHTVYASPTASQWAALKALQTGEDWVNKASALYKSAGHEAADMLDLPRPQGSTFLFLDVSHKLDERGVFGFLEDCLDDGLILAPGPSFGTGYEEFVRICFTAAPNEVVQRAVSLLRRRLLA
jgi:aspartate/methionine/tyrosine aminotransferase